MSCDKILQVLIKIKVAIHAKLNLPPKMFEITIPSALKSGNYQRLIFKPNNLLTITPQILVMGCLYIINQCLQAYCEIGVVDCFKNLWAGMYDRVANSDYSSSARSDGCEIDARIETGDSPKFTAKITVR